MSTGLNKTALVADIGGTNARFAIAKDGVLQHQTIEKLPTANYATLAECVGDYLKIVGESPAEACLAMAGATTTPELVFSNNHWRFYPEQLGPSMGVQRLMVINDFTAQALSITSLEAGECETLYKANEAANAPKLVIGPGTGLGVSALIPSASGYIALAGEGGHATFAASNPRELAVLEKLQARQAHVAFEYVVSGTGLQMTYAALREIDGLAPEASDAATIVTKASQGESQAAEAVDLLVSNLGRIMGDYALMLGARGGIYIAGGVLPKLMKQIDPSLVLSRLHGRGVVDGYIKEIPVYLVNAEFGALKGTIAALTQAPMGARIWENSEC